MKSVCYKPSAASCMLLHSHFRFRGESVAKLSDSRLRGLKACLSVRSCAATVEGGGFMISDTKLGAASDGCGWSTTEKLG